MHTGCSAWFGGVLAMVATAGCAPLFTGETGLYRGPARPAASEDLYGAGVVPAVEAHEPGVDAHEPAWGTPESVSRQPLVVVVPASESCPAPVVVTIACAGEYERDAPPPAPYKPWPDEAHRAPSLYHDR